MAQMMTQRERIFSVIHHKGYISNRDLREMGLLHVGRNRITDQASKDYWAAFYKKIRFVNGKGFDDHRWEICPLKDELNERQGLLF